MDLLFRGLYKSIFLFKAEGSAWCASFQPKGKKEKEKERGKGFRTTKERGTRGLEREKGRKDVAFGSVVI